MAVARSNLLRIFEEREKPCPIQNQVDDEREQRLKVRRGMEAVEGEVAMDEQGDGFINIAKVILHVSCIFFVRTRAITPPAKEV